MDKFFSVFGKAILAVVVVAGLIGGGIYFGQKLKSGSIQVSISPTPAQRAVITPSSSASAVTTPTSTQPTHFAVSAGGISPFSAYTLSAITGWTLSKDHSSALDKITLTQGDYQLIILQAAIGGGGCTFPGDQQTQMSMQLTNPIDILLLSGQPLRRGTAQSPNTNQASFTICQKGTDGSYGSLTTFGAINYATPLNPDASVVAQMDAMVGSLQKQ